jgi:hypothetical protein
VSRAQLLLLHLANLAVCGTGLIYAWMQYLVEPTDEWAVVNHPWQPHFQHIHVLVAPLLVFAVGLIWSTHVIGKVQNGHKNRMAGIGLTALFLPMAASGYLLQVAVEPGWRRTWIWVHVVSSLLWVATFVAHQVRALATKSRNGLGEDSQSPVVTPFRISVPSSDPVEQSADSPQNDASAGSTSD